MASVRVDGAPGWIDSVQSIRQRCEAADKVFQLSPSTELPNWLHTVGEYTIWERNNRWTLQAAMDYGANKVRLLALWDGQADDAGGGTSHMVELANEAGAGVENIDRCSLFGLA